MKKILIGVSAPNNKSSQAANASLAEVFSLEHINMRQPLINMIAQLTAMDPCAQEYYCSQQCLVEHLGVTIAELEIALGFSIRSIKSDFFIQRCAESIAISNSGLNGELFSGQIISGIKTELEAQWIRDQGGQIIHIYQYSQHVNHHPLNEIDGDFVCVFEHPTETPELVEIIAKLREQIYPTREAA